MLQIYNQVEIFFQLILEISLDLLSITIDKSLEISQVFTKERLKFILHKKNKVVFVLFLLIPLPVKANLILKEGPIKRNFVNAFGSSGSLVILSFLTKVIAFHMGFPAVHVQGAGFQKLVKGLFGDGWGLSLKTILKISYKYFLMYLGIASLITRKTATKAFSPRGKQVGWRTCHLIQGVKKNQKELRKNVFYGNIRSFGLRSSWSSLKHLYPNKLVD